MTPASPSGSRDLSASSHLDLVWLSSRSGEPVENDVQRLSPIPKADMCHGSRRGWRLRNTNFVSDLKEQWTEGEVQSFCNDAHRVGQRILPESGVRKVAREVKSYGLIYPSLGVSVTQTEPESPGSLMAGIGRDGSSGGCGAIWI